MQVTLRLLWMNCVYSVRDSRTGCFHPDNYCCEHLIASMVHHVPNQAVGVSEVQL